MFPEDLIESATQPVVAPLRFERPKRRLWLNILLLLATMFTTTMVGAHMQYNFRYGLPFFDANSPLRSFLIGLHGWHYFLSGLPFSLTLLTILMAHELGHYIACLYYDVDATLPFFLPFPTPFTGTLGAFIRIRSMVENKRILFDIGIAGPLAGFLFLVPALGVGLAFSKIVPGINHLGTEQMGAPALQWLLQHMIFPGVPDADVYLHPVARAAWVGMFATALNLLPAGQLDGGHIVYALLGRSHRWITNILILTLLPMGWLFWQGWWFWAVLLFFLARRHPPLYDDLDPGPQRVKLGVVALIVFLLCFSPTPIIG